MGKIEIVKIMWRNGDLNKIFNTGLELINNGVIIAVLYGVYKSTSNNFILYILIVYLIIFFGSSFTRNPDDELKVKGFM